MSFKKYTPKPPVVRTPFKPSYPPSPEQTQIFEAFNTSLDNIHIEASPGSGKSTTLTWAMTFNKNPSSAMVAFGADIVADIEPRCAPNVFVGTCHSMARKAIVSKINKQPFLQQNKVQNIICKEYPWLNAFEAPVKERGPAFARMNNLISLIDKLRVNLTDELDLGAVVSVANQYNIEVDDDTVTLIPHIFDKMLEDPKVIDFTDMLWMPVRMNFEIKKFDMVYTDERQDFNTLMIEFIKRMTGERIITVGDSNQSIMGFAGADLKSTERLIAAFPGQELPLNVCYRCGTDIVELAATIYDKIKPYEKNHKGVVEHRDKIDLSMPEGSMIISRRNANLIQPCFELLKMGRKAIIKGKDIGAGLIKLIDQMRATDIMDLGDKINQYRFDRIEKLMSYKDVKVESIEAVNDQCDCILTIIENCADLHEVKAKIDIIFDKDTKGITLSSIHRSKGKESKMVTIIDYGKVRLNHDKMSESDHVQEKNLQFVALTRAIDTLHLIN